VDKKVDVLRLEDRNLDTLSGRSDVWENLSSIISNHPLGTTLQDYEVESPIYHHYMTMDGDLVPNLLMPHNVIFDVAVFAGVPAGIVFLNLVISWIIRSFKILVGADGIQQIGALVLIVILAHMFMDMWYFSLMLAVSWLYLKCE
jgi:O-antigen ligase